MLMRFSTLLFLLIMISGCATLELLSFGASGVSYIVSGKSLSDNFISVLIDKDCALHRIVLGEQICFASDATDTMIAAQQQPAPYMAHVSQANLPLTIDEQITEQGDDNIIALVEQELASNIAIKPVPESLNRDQNTAPVAVARAVIAQNTIAQNFATNNLVEQQTAKNMALMDELQVTNELSLEQEQVYVVIGSFNQLKFAEERKLAYLGLHAEVISNTNSDKTHYRVVVGPFSNMGNESSLKQLPELEKFNPWRLTLCASTMSAPPCKDTMVAGLSN
jgi:hypothetical protein